jgi:lysophospholipase L1-like esterase
MKNSLLESKSEQKPGKSGGRSAFLKASIVVLEVFALLFLLEIAARYLYKDGSIYSYNAYCHIQPKPNLKGFRQLSKYGRYISVSTNADGFRTPEAKPEKPQECFRIICIGDSVTFGNIDINEDETYPYFLQRDLSSRCRGQSIEVINAGCPSYTCIQGLERFKRAGLKYHPDLIVVGFIHHELFESAMTDRKKFSEPEMLKSVKNVLYKSSFYCILKKFIKNQPVMDIEPAPGQGVERVPLADYRDAMNGFVQIARSGGMRIVFVNLPVSNTMKQKEIEYRQMLEDLAFDSDVPFLDLNREFNYYSSSSNMKLLEDDGIHPNAEGNRFFAKCLANFLEVEKILPKSRNSEGSVTAPSTPCH